MTGGWQRRLALAVLTQALRDACGHGGRAVQALDWLRSDVPALRFWCACAGVDQRHVRRLADRGTHVVRRRVRRALQAVKQDAAQADALDIESQAKRRLADEYDAAQQRGGSGDGW